jgi:hypothetical protein
MDDPLQVDIEQRTAMPSTPLRQQPLTSADDKSPTDSAEEALS